MSFSGRLRSVGAQSEVSASVGAEGRGRAVWVSACSGGELGFHRDFAKAPGFGSAWHRFGGAALEGFGSRRCPLLRQGSDGGVNVRVTVSKSVLPDRNGRFGVCEVKERERRFGGNRDNRRKAGGFGLQYRRA
jgi:hypothetical protein